MKVATIIDQVELELILVGKPKIADRGMLLKHLRYDLDTLLSMEEWDWAASYLDPAITCVTGQRDYDLPANFGDNFVKGGGSVGDHFVCKIDDTDSEQLLDYESPAQFYARDLTIEANAKPARYTITSKPDSTRRLSVSPPPDANGTDGYTILGLYVPNANLVHFESDLPPMPTGFDILKYMVLRRFDDRYISPYNEALAKLYGRAALQRTLRFVPNLKQGY